jgi:DNA invertase Pin-like site-specific DNA recombinase
MEQNQDVIAIYSRKSRFTGKGESVGNQEELCRSYIRTAFGDGYADSAVVFEDEGFSGGNLNRPGFQKMMKAARAHRFRAVVVYRLDRISRSIGDFAGLIQELGRLQIDFVSIRESFDTSSPMGRAMMYIASVFSQLERETIAERIRDNLHELAKTGRWLGGTTPTGYTSESIKSVTVDGKSKRSCHLKLIPEEAELVRRIYRLYEQTDSLTATEAELLRTHTRTKTGREFTRFSIRAILQNPVYLLADQDAYRYFADRQAELCSDPEAFDGVRGILAYHRTEQEKGRPTVYLPVSQWIISVGRHPGIIPAPVWIRVQESLERNKSGAYRKPRSNQALLTGLLRCRCGGRMYPKLSRRVTETGEEAFRYVCKQRERSRGALCDCASANGNALDAAVLEQLGNLNESEDYLSRLEKGRSLFAGSREARDGELEELRRQQAEARRKMTALVDSLADFADSDAAGPVKERIEELHAAAARLQTRITERESLRDQNALDDGTFENLRRRLGSLRDCVDHMTVEQRRRTVRRLVGEVVWDGQCARVVLLGASDQEPEKTPWGEDCK